MNIIDIIRNKLHCEGTEMITQAKLDELKSAADIADKALSDAAAAFAADLPKSTAIARLRAFGDNVSSEVQAEYHSVVTELESLL